MKKPFVFKHWRSLSLNAKFQFIFSALQFLTILFIAATIILGTLFINSYHQAMSACYQVEHLMTVLEEEAMAYASAILLEENGKEETDFQALSDQAVSLIASLRFGEYNQEHLALAHAISVSHETYMECCARSLQLQNQGEPFADLWETSTRISSYLNSYSRALLREVIREGNSNYQRSREIFELFPFFLGALLLMMVLMQRRSARWISRSIVTPLGELAVASRRMANHEYDFPDLAPQESEMNDLVIALNQFKHATLRYIESLEQKNHLTQRLHQEEIHRMQMETDMNNLRISLLMSQINPHFLFNTLNTISRMAQIESAEQTKDLIMRLASLFRYKLQNRESMVSLEREISIVRDYWTIQHIRYGERIRLTITQDREYSDLRLPVLSLQPLVENAVIHGISPLPDGGSIHLEIHESGGATVITLRDNGKGIQKERLEALQSSVPDDQHQVTGLGIANVRSRILMMLPSSTFRIESTEGKGTMIQIVLPKQTSTNEGAETDDPYSDRRG